MVKIITVFWKYDEKWLFKNLQLKLELLQEKGREAHEQPW